jgi:hypothetical protein
VLVAATLLVGAAPAATQSVALANGRVRAELGPRGLVLLTDLSTGAGHRFARDGFRLRWDTTTVESAALGAPSRSRRADRVTYRWVAGDVRIDVVYELRPGWRFLSKQIAVSMPPTARYRIAEVTPLDAALAEAPSDVVVPKSARPDLGTADYGGAMRFGPRHALLAVVQNPFLWFESRSNEFALGYRPDMDWRPEYGSFTSDRALLAPVRLAGRRNPESMIPEWRFAAPVPPPGLDLAEVEAFTEMVRAFLLDRRDRPINVFVAWCVNDYQIDVATNEGRAEYRRVLDRAAELGAQYVVYAPTNSEPSRRLESADDWRWENLLWLGLGQKLRRNEWAPRTGALPASVSEMLEYAGGKGLKLLAYVYPVVPFSQNPEWLATRAGAPDRRYASLGVRSLQDWLIETLEAFYRRTGIGGYSFDHTFLAFEGTSRYAQWWGWRRVMEELRRRIPEIVIDGRQAYHLYGPWSWLAGSYPHPTFHDEQPESFAPFPDLHFDRVSANRQRFTAWRYRNHEFAPSELVPGFITHQTPRLDDTGEMPQRRTERDVELLAFRRRDWDYLGWRYSLLSSIATGGWNNVLDMIPARDPEEYRHFSEADRKWIRGWLDWTVTNRELLRHTRAILGQPAIGKVDGTSAIVRDRGYVFLFNPNGRRLPAEFALDSTIGLTEPGRYVLRESSPREGRLIGKPGSAFWSYGDRVSRWMDGGSAMVLEVLPAPRRITEPMLFNAPGTATLEGDTLRLSGVRGEVGTAERLVVLLPSGRAAGAVEVNGRLIDATEPGNPTYLDVQFAGERFGAYQPLGEYDPTFSGGRFTARVRVPQRIFDQLAARRRAWPIPWTAEDYRTTWLAPERLLLFVQIAEPEDRWEARLTINGRPVELRKAYASVWHYPRAFVGFYADISLLSPDRDYTVELDLPRLRPGQFQGLFFENVEAEYTDLVEPSRRAPGSDPL